MIARCLLSLAERTPVPVATGEIEAGRWRFKELLDKANGILTEGIRALVIALHPVDPAFCDRPIQPRKRPSGWKAATATEASRCLSRH